MNKVASMSYAHGALVKLAQHGISAEQFVQHAIQTRDPALVKVANVIVDGIAAARQHPAYAEKVAAGLAGMAADLVDSIPTASLAADVADDAGRAAAHATAAAPVSRTIANTPINTPRGGASRRADDSFLGNMNRRAGNFWYGDNAMRNRAALAGAGGLGVGAAGTGGLVYGMQPADTWQNNLRGVVGLPQQSRFGAMFG